MVRLEERYPWSFLVISILLIVNALIWFVEALSENQNAYLAALLILLNLVGSRLCFSAWRKRRAGNEHIPGQQ
jgi:hypothetical protein